MKFLIGFLIDLFREYWMIAIYVSLILWLAHLFCVDFIDPGMQKMERQKADAEKYLDEFLKGLHQ